jgi:hypothetical protein
MNGDLANGVAGLYYLGANDIFRFQSNVIIIIIIEKISTFENSSFFFLNLL